jgi:hypothetical protein
MLKIKPESEYVMVRQRVGRGIEMEKAQQSDTFRSDESLPDKAFSTCALVLFSSLSYFVFVCAMLHSMSDGQRFHQGFWN